jgi:hypothetical protein
MSKNGNPSMQDKYEQTKRLYKQEIRKAKINYNDNLISNSDNVNSTIWKLIKKEAAISKNSINTELTPDTFNDYFTNTNLQVYSNNEIKTERFPQLKDAVFDSVFTNHLCKNSMTEKQLKWQKVSLASLILLVKGLKSSRSEDYYGLSSYLLKHIIDIIIEPFGDLVNDSLMCGHFPDDLKIAIVVPILKKGNRNEVANYRPIALLPILSKLFELVIKEQLCNHLNKCNFILENQFGFREGKSTIDAIQNVTTQIYENFERKNITLATFIDISKAFDSISHSILIGKLHEYGLTGNTLQLLKSYLVNRKQLVKVNNKTSQLRSIDRGVPQGSVLGPLLFILFMNDLPTALRDPITMFADDTLILSTNHNRTNLITASNESLSSTKNWLERNDLKLNEEKTEQMIFSLNKSLRNSNFPVVSKYLGIYIDNTLSWSIHIENIISSLSKGLYIIRRVKQSLSINCLKKVYFAFFHSFLNYGILLWGGSPRSKELFVWQKKAVRIILGLLYCETCRGEFKRLNIMTVPSLYVYQLLLYMRKKQNITNPAVTSHDYETRSRHQVMTPYSRLTKLHNSYIVQGPQFFNLLPLNFRYFSLKIFKSTMKRILIECEGYTLNEVKLFLSNYDYSSVTVNFNSERVI